MKLSTDQKGAIAESAIVHAAIRLGIGVFRPVTDGHRYDLIFDFFPQLVRVQCKWAPLQGDVIILRAYSSRRTAAGLLRRVYTAGEIDAMAAYCPELNRCFYIPAERVDGHQEMSLRTAPSRNNQSERINWADDYAFERLESAVLGAVAQLGERCDGIAEVRGSSPLGSITSAFDERPEALFDEGDSS